MFRERRGALPFPAAPTEAGAARVGRGNRAATLFSSPGGAGALLAAGSPEPKKGIRKFRLGRNRGRRLCSCAFGEPGRGGGRREATTRPGAGGVPVPPSGAAFVLRPRLSQRRFGLFQFPARGCGAATGCASRAVLGGGVGCVRAGLAAGCSECQAWGYRSRPPGHSCNLHL